LIGGGTKLKTFPDKKNQAS